MIIDRLLDLLTARETTAPASSEEDLEVAVAALLIEAARMDARFDLAERRVIERLLAERFDLAPEAVDDLVQSRRKGGRAHCAIFSLHPADLQEHEPRGAG